ncbi:hypothetical protein GW891_03470 [bacterium]|nr:hypothetical protein [bacterium]
MLLIGLNEFQKNQPSIVSDKKLFILSLSKVTPVLESFSICNHLISLYVIFESHNSIGLPKYWLVGKLEVSTFSDAIGSFSEFLYKLSTSLLTFITSSVLDTFFQEYASIKYTFLQ